ncbi:MAG: hypothetical protein ACRDS0_15555 [Pseudonocardiaceae bacterium]
MNVLTPNETLRGAADTKKQIFHRLAALRSAPRLHDHHPDISFSRMTDVLRSPLIDQDVVQAGWDIISRRYSALGLHRLLPPERVWVGTHSLSPDPVFGGFHRPGQGYRHLQAAAVITAYGDLSGKIPWIPELAALDLLRSYAHDCLHYGSYRRYSLPEAGEGVDRIRYGINFRRPDGRTYSAQDGDGATATRNLGVVMEGATDREARSVAREAGIEALIRHPPSGVDYFAFRDETGLLDSVDLCALQNPRWTYEANPAARSYLRNLAAYARGVGVRYEVFLREVARCEADQLHSLILTSMIGGRLAPLSSWLAARHGSGAFAALFKAKSYSSTSDPTHRPRWRQDK